MPVPGHSSQGFQELHLKPARMERLLHVKLHCAYRGQCIIVTCNTRMQQMAPMLMPTGGAEAFTTETTTRQKRKHFNDKVAYPLKDTT